MIFKIIFIASRTSNFRIATIMDANATNGKEIQCTITECGESLHMLPIKSASQTSLIPNTYMVVDKKLDDLQVNDTFIVED